MAVSMQYINTPKGSEFDDGVRVGPSFPSSMMFKNKDRVGLQLAPWFWMNVTAPSGAVGASGDAIPAVSIFSGKNTSNEATAETMYRFLPTVGAAAESNFLSGQQSLTSPVTGQSGLATVLGGTGRVLAYSTSVAGVFIAFGYDMYSQPMVEQVTGTANQATFGSKAFYSLTDVFFAPTGPTPAGSVVVSVSTTNIVGLPYWLDVASHFLPVGLVGGSVIAGLSILTAPAVNTSDVRGLFGTSTVESPPTNETLSLDGMAFFPGFYYEDNLQAAAGGFGGFLELEGVTKPVPQPPIMEYLPASVYSAANFPDFGCTFNADGTINTSAQGMYPVLSNQVTQYGAQQFWSAALATQAANAPTLS